MKHVASRGGRTKSALWTILGILAELMLTAAAICALYIAWQMWWTGVQSEHNQIETRQSVSWSDPGKSGNVTVAKAQQGDPPVQPQSATEGELIAQIYIPRFGSQWQRNLVEGTDLTQLNKHGLGHYTDSQMPGQVGNFAIRRPPQRLRAAARRRRQTAGRRPDHRPHAGLLVRVPLHQLQNRAADTRPKWWRPTPKTPAQHRPNAC